MNYTINNLPERIQKPRNSGITMMMDKGLSLRQVEDFIEVAGTYTDMVKLGWATSYVTPNLDDKLAIYRNAGIPVYFGGTFYLFVYSLINFLTSTALWTFTFTK